MHICYCHADVVRVFSARHKYSNDKTKSLIYFLEHFCIFKARELYYYTTHRFLTIENQARTPQLYLLPKIHKQDNPGRPIISGCGGPTVKLSQYADHLLKPLLKHIPSYVQDTTDFLRRIFSLNQDLPDNIIFITLDVKSL